jgi:hypothetical protein
MTIWTVSVIDNEANCRPTHHICGSYTTRGVALDECVRWIMERFDRMPFLAHAMANNENHKFMLQFFCEDKDGRTLIRRGMCSKFVEWLRDELGRQGFYCASDGENEYVFSVDENDVEGTIWQTVTWGDDLPYPEMFTSEETAVETFIDYVKDLYMSHHMKWSDKFIRETRESLKEDGKVQVNLNDGTSVSCVLYSGGADNVKE